MGAIEWYQRCHQRNLNKNRQKILNFLREFSACFLAIEGCPRSGFSSLKRNDYVFC